MTKKMTECKIEYINKFRNGKPKYWCKTHFAIASAKNGEVPLECEKHNQPPISENDKFILNPADWEGGIGIWGSLDPVYNTSADSDHHPGIHLHARANEEGEKQIDYTFKEVDIKAPEGDLFGEKYIRLNTEIAHAYTASMVFGKKMKYLLCPHCGQPHIDADYFSVTYHRKHMCTYCGKDFIDTEPGISNPVVEVQRIFKSSMEQRTLDLVTRQLIISQKDYPGGIQIWGSNPAIIWTAGRKEEHGIHVHVYKDRFGPEALKDDTFGTVIIDGIKLSDTQIRCLMVQQSLKNVISYVTSLRCPNCHESHFDRGDNGVMPHQEHFCEKCKTNFNSENKCIGNPAVDSLKQLKLNYAALQK
jgi:transposase-like protein